MGTKQATKERSIAFTADMVRAMLDGRKTQTRRPVKHRENRWEVDDYQGFNWPYWPCYVFGEPEPVSMPCPYGNVGDTFRISEAVKVTPGDEPLSFFVHYPADGLLLKRYWDQAACDKIAAYKNPHLRGVTLPAAYARPERFVITSVRVERLQAISEADAIAEGIEPVAGRTGEWWCAGELRKLGQQTSNPVLAFETIWRDAYGPEAWSLNPWVWVIEFRRAS
jgi:hypothetical protein